MKYSFFKQFLLVILLILPGLLEAQVKFYATCDAKEVLKGSRFNVRFVIEDAEDENFNPPRFEHFSLVSGPMLSNQMTIVNGRRSQTKSYGYTLLAMESGNFTIGSASIRVKGKTYKSKVLAIKVIEKTNKRNNNKQNEQVFLRAEISDSVAYPGQQILLKYVLYYNQRVRGYNFLSIPDFDGFYSQDINAGKNIQRRVIEGKEYQSEVLKTVALFPQKLGNLEIPAVQVSIGLLQRNNPFSFFNETKQVPLTSNSNKVDIIPLPDGAPASFNGAIGKFELDAKVNTLKLTTDDALSLQLTIQGNGLAKFIEAPELDLSEHFEVYDPKVIKEDVYATNDDIISRKSFEYLLVPLKEGRQSFRLDFSYFDTDSSVYRTLRSRQFRIQVEAGKNKAIKLTPEELLQKYQMKPMMMDTALSSGKKHFFGTFLYRALVILLLLCIPGMLLYKWYRIKQGKIDPKLIKKKKAAREANRRLSEAQKLLLSNDHNAFYKSLSDALLKYISDKFSVQSADLGKDRIAEILKGKDIDEVLVIDYIAHLASCEKALFSGVAEKGNETIYESSRKLIQEMELHFQKK